MTVTAKARTTMMVDVEKLVSQSLVLMKNLCDIYKNWNLPGNIKALLEELNNMGGNDTIIMMRTQRVLRSTLYDARK